MNREGRAGCEEDRCEEEGCEEEGCEEVIQHEALRIGVCCSGAWEA